MQKIRWVYRNENTHHTESNGTGKNRILNGIGIPANNGLIYVSVYHKDVFGFLTRNVKVDIRICFYLTMKRSHLIKNVYHLAVTVDIEVTSTDEYCVLDKIVHFLTI